MSSLFTLCFWAFQHLLEYLPVFLIRTFSFWTCADFSQTVSRLADLFQTLSRRSRVCSRLSQDLSGLVANFFCTCSRRFAFEDIRLDVPDLFRDFFLILVRTSPNGSGLFRCEQTSYFSQSSSHNRRLPGFLLRARFASGFLRVSSNVRFLLAGGDLAPGSSC